MIPPLLHRIWLGPPMPDRFEVFWGEWMRLNPRWRFHTWRERDLRWLRNIDLFNETTEPSGRSDVARYEILLRQGGCYVDCDVEPLRPLDGLLDGVACFAGYEDRQWLCNAVMGAEPGHPAVARLVDELPSYAATFNGDDPQMRTGPKFLSAMWKGRTDVRLFPPETFYPYTFDKPDPGPPYPDSWAVHRWAGAA